MFPFHSPPSKQERGQALVLIALVLVALIGFAGVAIDGGNLYTEQRRAQAAADNAVLAAAFKQMKGETSTPTLRTEALNNAKVNAYSNDGATNWVSFNRPPTHGAHRGDSNYMEVVITQSVQTALVHFVFQRNPVAVTVFAVAHGKSAEPFMAGFAIAAMHTTCDPNLFTARGGANSIIKDGGIFVNAPPGCNSINLSGVGIHIATTTSAACPNDQIGPYNATTNPNGCYINGQFPIQVGGAQTEGTLCHTPTTSNPIDWWTGGDDHCNFYPGVITAAPQVTNYPPPVTTSDFACGSPPKTVPNGSGTINLTPGSYSDGMNSHGNLVLAPGIYCITGVGSANKVLDAPSIVGQGVFIYIQPAAAEFKFTGNNSSLLSLSAPRSGENGLDCSTAPVNALCALQGIVMYKPNGPDSCDNNAVDMEFGGQGTMIIRGLIWAPKSYFVYTGGGDLYMSGQSIVACGKYSGTGKLDITYNPDDSFVPPPTVQLDN